jgi:hypothetical protein
MNLFIKDLLLVPQKVIHFKTKNLQIKFGNRMQIKLIKLNKLINKLEQA